jgi:hypothetical protein
MGILRIFRRTNEKKGKAERHQHRNLTGKELQDFPEHLRKKANLVERKGLWNITEWRDG